MNFRLTENPLLHGGYLIRPLGIVNLVQNILYQNLSIIAQDIETGEVVGINTNCLLKRSVIFCDIFDLGINFFF